MLTSSFPPGTYEADFDAANYAGGVYYYKALYRYFFTNKENGTGKMINTIYSIGTNRKHFAFIAWLGISVIFIFHLSIPAQPVWVTQNPVPQCNTLNDTKFIGSIGYSAGNYGTILKSTNGGLNWFSQNSTTTEDLKSISFIQPNTGFAAGGSNTWIILKTINGGTNWTLSSTGGGDILTRYISMMPTMRLPAAAWDSLCKHLTAARTGIT